MKVIEVLAAGCLLISAVPASAAALECSRLARVDGSIPPALSRPEVLQDGEHFDVNLRVDSAGGGRTSHVTFRVFPTDSMGAHYSDGYGHATLSFESATSATLYVNGMAARCTF